MDAAYILALLFLSKMPIVFSPPVFHLYAITFDGTLRAFYLVRKLK